MRFHFVFLINRNFFPFLVPICYILGTRNAFRPITAGNDIRGPLTKRPSPPPPPRKMIDRLFHSILHLIQKYYRTKYDFILQPKVEMTFFFFSTPILRRNNKSIYFVIKFRRPVVTLSIFPIEKQAFYPDIVWNNYATRICKEFKLEFKRQKVSCNADAFTKKDKTFDTYLKMHISVLSPWPPSENSEIIRRKY